MTIDERIEALTMNLELAHRDIQDLRSATQELRSATQELRSATQQDGQNIRALAQIAADSLDSIKRLERIATAHEQRIDRLEDQQS